MFIWQHYLRRFYSIFSVIVYWSCCFASPSIRWYTDRCCCRRRQNGIRERKKMHQMDRSLYINFTSLIYFHLCAFLFRHEICRVWCKNVQVYYLMCIWIVFRFNTLNNSKCAEFKICFLCEFVHILKLPIRPSYHFIFQQCVWFVFILCSINKSKMLLPKRSTKTEKW